MKTYTVRWEIEIESISSLGAALMAQRWMEDRDTYWVFEVTDEKGATRKIDLEEFAAHVEKRRSGAHV